MQRSFKSFEDAFNAPMAANDNTPKKPSQARYRGTLPALRWLYNHDPELAAALAGALPRPESNWSADITDSRHEIRPTIGEMMKAASDAFRVFVRDGVRHEGKGLMREPRGPDATYKSDERVWLGNLLFNRGRLVEWGKTRKGKKLRPVERIIGPEQAGSARNPSRYLRTRPTTPSPLHAAPNALSFSGEPALPPMYDPIDGVEANRAMLAEAYRRSPNVKVTKCPTAVANGAIFLGGVSRPKGNTSAAAVQMWEAPEQTNGEANEVIEEVAARGTLKSIGERLGFAGESADRRGKEALLNAAKVLVAANDNKTQEKSAA